MPRSRSVPVQQEIFNPNPPQPVSEIIVTVERMRDQLEVIYKAHLRMLLRLAEMQDVDSSCAFIVDFVNPVTFHTGITLKLVL